MPKKFTSPWNNLISDTPKPDVCFRDIPKPYIPVDSCGMAASAKYAAFASASGGGMFHYHKINSPGRAVFAAKGGDHTNKILDLAFSPFDDDLLATSSMDTQIHLNRLADYEAKEQCSKDCAFEGHEKNVLHVKWHPSAINILASGAMDSTVKLWDVESEAEALSVPTLDPKIFSMCWSNDGQYLGWSTKGKDLTLQDPRQEKPMWQKKVFESNKTSQVFWADHKGFVGCFCYNKQARRKLVVWDLKKMDDGPIYDEEVDQQSSPLFAFYDQHNETLYGMGRGEGSVQLWHMRPTGPFAKKGYASNQSQRGGCFIPKRCVDIEKKECARFLKLMDNPKEVQPISFTLLRKQPGFNKEIYPDCFMGTPTCQPGEYLKGECKDLTPLTSSMNPKDRKENVVKKRVPYAKLEAENQSLKARIAELEAQLAKGDSA